MFKQLFETIWASNDNPKNSPQLGATWKRWRSTWRRMTWTLSMVRAGDDQTRQQVNISTKKSLVFEALKIMPSGFLFPFLFVCLFCLEMIPPGLLFTLLLRQVICLAFTISSPMLPSSTAWYNHSLKISRIIRIQSGSVWNRSFNAHKF